MRISLLITITYAIINVFCKYCYNILDLYNMFDIIQTQLRLRLRRGKPTGFGNRDEAAKVAAQDRADSKYRGAREQEQKFHFGL
jgi:hypothetical protein